MKKNYIILLAGLLALMPIGCGPKHVYTKGPGQYPGDPLQDDAPSLVADYETYGNIARGRMAYHSSSYDYNLTAQLVTDGIITDTHPSFIQVSTHLGTLKKREREWLFDGKIDSRYRVPGDDVFLQLEFAGPIPEFTEMKLRGTFTHNTSNRGNYQITFYGSQDGEKWTLLKKEQGQGLLGSSLYGRMHQFNLVCPVVQPTSFRFYKVAFHVPGVEEWSFSDWDFFLEGEPVPILPSANFVSAWMSEGTGKEWLMVDFGVSATIDSVVLHWINKAMEGSIEMSDNGTTWTTAAVLSGGINPVEIIRFDAPVRGRYLKLLMEKPLNKTRYIVSELEAFGTGTLVPVPKERELPKGNYVPLSKGDWRLQRSSQVEETGQVVSRKDYIAADTWPVATVPGTVLTSYINTGAVPNPNFADNQLQISESFFHSDFWYRTTFSVPEDFINQKLFLHFDGINWKANVFLNGKEIHRMEGAFDRAKINITKDIILGADNVLAVRIIKNKHFGAVKEQNAQSPDQNGGILGADNPTFHASIGWDWIPTIRGRNMGIWNNVYLTTSGSVTIEDPFVQTRLPLPDTTFADIRLEATLKNHQDIYIGGVWEGTYKNIPFREEVTLAPFETRTVSATIQLRNPKLWWPKGYGKPHLYPVHMKFLTENTVSDSLSFQSGVRQMDFDEENGVLSLYINGRRFIGRGGNWGFPESNLNYRDREYDIAVAYHADMNFTMIRNWVGQTGHDAFYEACDRHGIMVWQDFWLANPWDGPIPDDNRMFMDNAKTLVRRIRNHPSIAIYAGRNEGYPPRALDTSLRSMLTQLHPGIHYISHSSTGVVSGEGPYRALPAATYFNLFGKDRMHTERGMPNVMNYESLKRTLPSDQLWPHNHMWGLHDFCLEGAQSAATFIEMTEKAFGPIQDARTFTEYAQWINYDGYRALFESRSEYRRGLLLWMSHSAWPSMVWQTYDYFFDPTAAYFGCKKASEPLHIQWNSHLNTVEVVNLHAGPRSNLTATARVFHTDGSVHWEKDTLINSHEDTTIPCFSVVFPETLSDVHFIKLTLTENGKTVSNNFYWRGSEEGNYKALLQLPKTAPQIQTKIKRSGKNWKITVRLKNNTPDPCLMMRLQVVGKKSREQILPAFYSDNFFSLMPGEKKKVRITVNKRDTQGQKPDIVIGGFNYERKK